MTETNGWRMDDNRTLASLRGFHGIPDDVFDATDLDHLGSGTGTPGFTSTL